MSIEGAQVQEMKRYSLVLPTSEFEAIKERAKAQGKSVVTMIRQSIKLGLKIDRAIENGAQLVIKDGDKETVWELIW